MNRLMEPPTSHLIYHTVRGGLWSLGNETEWSLACTLATGYTSDQPVTLPIDASSRLENNIV
jgi:hypothetical protein